jgi:hypothetical protein
VCYLTYLAGAADDVLIARTQRGEGDDDDEAGRKDLIGSKCGWQKPNGKRGRTQRSGLRNVKGQDRRQAYLKRAGEARSRTGT